MSFGNDSWAAWYGCCLWTGLLPAAVPPETAVRQYVNYLAQSMTSFFFNKVKFLKQGQAHFSSQHLPLAHLALGLGPSSISLRVAVSCSVQSL